MFLRRPKSSMDQINDVLGRLYAFLGLLLEGMENIDSAGVLHRVHRSVSAAASVLANLKHACPAETFQWFGIEMLAPLLCLPEGVANGSAHGLGKTSEVVQAFGNPEEWLEVFLGRGVHYANCGMKGVFVKPDRDASG